MGLATNRAAEALAIEHDACFEMEDATPEKIMLSKSEVRGSSLPGLSARALLSRESFN